LQTAHELQEEVLETMKLEQKTLLSQPLYLAHNSVHGVAFHKGLGWPQTPTSSIFTKYVDAPGVADFADAAYARNNIAVVANGAKHSELSKWVKEFFEETSSGNSNVKIQSTPSKFYGGEERIGHGSGNALILAFPGSAAFTSGSAYKPEIAVLAALLGGDSAIKWSPGFSILSNAAAATPGAKVVTNHAAYSDAGLLYVTLTGKASDIATAGKNVVEAIKKVASGDVSDEVIKKAVASARFSALEGGEQVDAGIEATGNGLIVGGKAFQISELAKGFEGVSKSKVVEVSTTP
jgi:ubiquinol-cytochrome c reductase core subunit 2